MTLLKNLFSAFAAVLACCALAGCERTSSETLRVTANIYIWTDAGTGCEYVGASSNGLTPRMGRDGKQVCSELKP